MSRVNIYIRKEDQERWEAIPNKSEWIHVHLADKSLKVPYKDVTLNMKEPFVPITPQKAPPVNSPGSEPQLAKRKKSASDKGSHVNYLK